MIPKSEQKLKVQPKSTEQPLLFSLKIFLNSQSHEMENFFGTEDPFKQLPVPKMVKIFAHPNAKRLGLHSRAQFQSNRL